MPHAFRVPSAFVLALALAAGAALAADGRIPISGPTTITKPGTYYLTRDVTDSGGTAIVIEETDGVTLDLAGHTVTETASGGRGVAILEASAHVTNGEIAGATAVYGSAMATRVVRLDHLVLRAGADAGVLLTAGADVLPHWRGTIVEDNQVHGGGTGIWLVSHEGAIVRGNTVTNVTNGIVVDYSSRARVQENNVWPSGTGIDLRRAPGSLVTGNAVGGGVIGIRVGTNTVSVTQNQVANNTDRGILLVGVTYTDVSGNTVLNNSNYGIDADAASTANSFRNNAVLHNGSGIYVEGGTNNVVDGNNLSANGWWGVAFVSGTGSEYSNNRAKGCTVPYSAGGATDGGNNL